MAAMAALGPNTLPDIVEGLAAGQICVWNWNPKTGEVSCVPEGSSLCPLPHSSGATLADYLNAIHQLDRTRVGEALHATAETRGEYIVEYRLMDSGASERWVEARGSAVVLGGAVVRLTGICTEITERRRSVFALARRKCQQETTAALGELVAGAMALQEFLHYVVGRIPQAAGADFCRFLELLPSGEEFLLSQGVGWQSGEVGVRRVPAGDGYESASVLAAHQPLLIPDMQREERFAVPGYLVAHGVRSSLSVAIRGATGRPFGILAIDSRTPGSFDFDDADFLKTVGHAVACAIQRGDSEVRQANLVRELRHRAGNLLTIVLALFNHSARDAAEVDDLAEKFTPRVMCLSRIHAHLSYEGWTTIGLHSALREITETFGDRVELVGPDLPIAAHPALALALAINEVLLNAKKYGALSVPGGTVRLSWLVERLGGHDQIGLLWVETGGPERAGAARSGFGTRLLHLVVESQLGGRLSISYPQGGATIRALIPLDELTRPTRETTGADFDVPAREVGA